MTARSLAKEKKSNQEKVLMPGEGGWMVRRIPLGTSSDKFLLKKTDSDANTYF